MKNRTMRAAALLLSLTLITTCFVGGTFAKYTTKDTGSDSARVAKWGIDVLVSGNLFGQYYNPNSAGTDGDKITAKAEHSVDVTTGETDNIVAPGTKNDKGFTVKISGTPEVAYKVTAKTGDSITGAQKNEDIFLGKGFWGVMVKAEGLNAASDVTKLYTKDASGYSLATGSYVANTEYYELHDAVEVTEDKYFPIKWTISSIKDTAASTTFGSITSLKDIADKMVEMLKEDQGDANVDAEADYTLTWEWPFEDKEDTTRDAKDTILGNLQADTQVVYKENQNDPYTTPGENSYNLDIVFNFEVVVEQVN